MEVKMYLYDEKEQCFFCPRCQSTDIEGSSRSTLSDDAHCNSCGLNFTIRQVALWVEE